MCLYLDSEGLEAECPDLGMLRVDVAYGGNFMLSSMMFKKTLPEVEHYTADKLEWARAHMAQYQWEIQFCSSWRWYCIRGCSISCGQEKSRPNKSYKLAMQCLRIKRSKVPGTGTSAPNGTMVYQGLTETGGSSVHESIIGSKFVGTIEVTTVAGRSPYGPGIEGWAAYTATTPSSIDDEDDPFAFSISSNLTNCYRISHLF